MPQSTPTRFMVRRIGFACFSSEGHLNPSITLATQLADRGHEIVFFSLADGREKIQRAGLRVRIYGEDQFSLADIRDGYAQLGRLSGMAAVRLTLDAVGRRAEVGLRDFPDQFADENIAGLLVDQILPDAAAVARAEQIPFVSICNALPMNLSADVPPVFSHGWPGRGLFSQLRNRALNGVANHLSKPILKRLNTFQRGRGLTPYEHAEQVGSDLAQITQIPKSFDFPDRPVPRCFHYSGPFHKLADRPAIAFPWDRIDRSRPLVYASMGTLQNRLGWVYRAIAEASKNLPIQLVISTGGGGQADQLNHLPGDPIVVDYAPQLQLLDHATLCITHAGLNTTLESLARGVPMLAIPITNDQPGVAARIQHTGCGITLRLRHAHARNLTAALRDLLSNPQYRSNAHRLRYDIQSTDGPKRAADIIEKSLQL